MPSPFCEKYQEFGTQDVCAARCGQPYSNRRPDCPYRRPRQWRDLDEMSRRRMRGNWMRRIAHEKLDERLATRDYIADELREACRAAQGNGMGRKRVSVPLEVIDKLLHYLSENGASTGLVEGVGASR